MTSKEEFERFREKMNKIILEKGDINIKRFFALDKNIYSDGALSAKTKELLGLATSMVLRCDDCIRYHILQCLKYKTSYDEFFETFSVALLVGGSIVIPHLRRAVAFLLENTTD